MASSRLRLVAGAPRGWNSEAVRALWWELVLSPARFSHRARLLRAQPSGCSLAVMRHFGRRAGCSIIRAVNVETGVSRLTDLDELRSAVGGGGAGGGSRDPDRQTGGEPPTAANRLIEFLNTLEKLVIAALERPAFFTGHNRRLRAAWVNVRPRFDALREGLESMSGDDLQRVGLTDAELDLKLAVFEDTARIFLAELASLDHGWVKRRLDLAPRFVVPSDVSSPPLPTEAERGHSRPVGWLLKGAKVSLETVLAVADKTVQSAAAAVGYANPGAGLAAGAAAEGIDEFKGMMEGILKRRKKAQSEG